ncbi:hypothetical protein BpHYR1_007283 [Brachionus plicatilis]|uniref:Uncharacterized protein n=1 Tax=Brachionus plicatilis TaxID=10195 RepID=A0A3M7Q2M6_BRAPC|nr:hypothetical protein BpHYR1_007283 [Brachionus plicatilis]
MRIFSTVWMVIIMIIVVVFISMFTSQLTLYGISGQPLSEKLIGLNKFSLDRAWIDQENAYSVEYESLGEMFSDLEEQKIDYILLDQVFVNFYSKVINEKFFVTKQVPRQKTYNVLLKGFAQSQLSCFQTTANLMHRLWVRQNMTLNFNKIRDKSKYFDITDQLLYPQRNTILFVSIGVLVMVLIGGVAWEITCLKQPGLSSFKTNKSGLLNSNQALSCMSNNQYRPRLHRIGYNLPTISESNEASQHNHQNEPHFNTSVIDNISSIRNTIASLLNSSECADKSVKFNPLVHNFYYSESSQKSSTEAYDQALINARNQAIQNRSIYTNEMVSDPSSLEESLKLRAFPKPDYRLDDSYFKASKFELSSSDSSSYKTNDTNVVNNDNIESSPDDSLNQKEVQIVSSELNTQANTSSKIESSMNNTLSQLPETYRELPRNESFYLNEISSIKL